MNEFWDNRYSSQEFVYGTEPNIFFKNEIEKLKPGRLFALAEGEGRNGVFAASLGWEVDAVDFSLKAKEKALRLAEEKKLKINYTVKDLNDFIPAANIYDAVSIIFLHLNQELSGIVHRRAIESLKTGGKIILEVYSKEQLGKESGGPQNINMLYSLEEIKRNFEGLKIISLEKKVVHLSESKFHNGEASVIQFIGERHR
jgi:SAM-dependent methyltransferase